MSRLQAELRRLYFFRGAEQPALDSGELALVSPDGQARAMVLELMRPANWDALSKVWQGVQAELDLPAPAIAVSGSDHYQLWFSLAQPVPAAQATAFLDSLRLRYLGDVAQERIAMTPSAASCQVQVPPMQAAPGQWSAFLAPDLAALFSEERWLDLPPSADAQADLLSRLQSAKPDDWRRALERLTTPAHAEAAPSNTPPAPPATSLDPRAFLLEVMNDRTVELHLRIEAAKALLPRFEGRRDPPA